jgi:hypothetical protein
VPSVIAGIVKSDAPEVRRADPDARRQAVLIVALGALVGALLIAGFDWYGNALRDWVRSQPSEMPRRLRLVFIVGAALLSAPAIVFAAYLWSLGAKVLSAQQCPPPGHRVIRDTPVIGGRAAMWRGRSYQILAVVLGVASVLLWLAVWRVAGTFRGSG